jgi:MoaA/NifB/PqqE/SkfB family radical SAM enzyme
MPMNKIKHAAERAAFSAVLDSAIKAVRGKSPEEMVQYGVKLIDLAQPLLKKRYPAEAFDHAREFVGDPNGKWMQFAYRAINEIDPHVLKMNVLNLGYEGMFAGYNYVCELREKEDCNMPWILLFDPTSACNLHCKGCWAAEYGNKLNLSYDDMEKIVTEGEELGIHWYMMTGGEPMCRKSDILKLAANHQSSVFHLFTNGTLIDEAFCKEVQKVGNMAFFLSIEGSEESNDSRRGEGVYDKVLHAFDLMKQYGLLFGTSICYTSANYKAVTSDEFMDMLISHGVRFNWYFHYMPIGDGANVNLMLNQEQRAYMIKRVREIRSLTGGKQIFCIDFQNDGEYIDGCIAGGRQYAHINPNGDVEPCVFIHYSNANIHDKSLKECLQQPLFKEYHKGQPFNENHLRPCPMLENPEILGEMVKRSGAHSTDVQRPESTEDVYRRCRPYANQWTPTADRIWAEEQEAKKGNAPETQPDCAACAGCSKD